MEGEKRENKSGPVFPHGVRLIAVARRIGWPNARPPSVGRQAETDERSALSGLELACRAR